MKMPSKHSLAVATVTLTLALLGPTAAVADSSPSTLDVTANVVAKCTIGAATLSFGDYDPVATHATTDLDAETELSVTCTSGAAYTVTLGLGGSGDRTMTQTTVPGGGAVTGTPGSLNYELFTDGQRLAQHVWSTDATTGLAGTGNGAAQKIPVYGRVTANQSVPVGGYADSVVSTVHF